MSNIIPKDGSSPTGKPTTRQIEIGKPVKDSLRDRLNKARQQSVNAEQNAATAKDRIALVLDCSGSMAREPIAKLKQAVEGFVQNMPLDGSCSVALVPFGTREENSVGPIRPLTCNKALLLSETAGFEAHGGTPMAEALEQTIKGVSITRAVLVSDGFPDFDPTKDPPLSSWDAPPIIPHGSVSQTMKPYVETKTPIDTVHIGHGGGEEVLKKIAAITGGIFMEFRDIGQFMQAFKFLTPANRGLLMAASAEDVKRLTGSDEVIK